MLGFYWGPPCSNPPKDRGVWGLSEKGILEKKMETTIMAYIGDYHKGTIDIYIYIDILGLYRDNGKENGNYGDYRVYKGFIGVISG